MALDSTRNTRRLVTGLLVSTVGTAAASFLTGCGGGDNAAEKTVAASTTPAAVKVTLAPIETRKVERTVDVVGTLKGWEDVTIGTRKEGRVSKVLHDMGDTVKPGEPLVVLETEDARYAVLQAKSKYLADLARLGITQAQAEEALKRFGVTEKLLIGEEANRLIEQSPAIVQATVAVEKAQNNLNRQRQLYQRGAGTLEELQNIENDFKAAKASRDTSVTNARNVIAMAINSKVAIDVAEQSLKEMTIVAPTPTLLPQGVTGPIVYSVAKRSVSEGQFLKVGEATVELVIQNPLRLWGNVPERYSADVRNGQSVRVTVASYPDTVFEGTVARINPLVDPASRTFQVEALIPNNRGLLRPGGFAKASIVTDSRSEATVVPVESIVKYAGVTKVFLVEGEKVRSINVETGLEGTGWVEVIGKLPGQGQVVTTGQTQLAEGTSVEVRKPEPAKPDSPAKTEAEAKAGASPNNAKAAEG
jgi:membrane fusion protein (multidrug efflux system)